MRACKIGFKRKGIWNLRPGGEGRRGPTGSKPSPQSRPLPGSLVVGHMVPHPSEVRVESYFAKEFFQAVWSLNPEWG